MIMKKGLIIGKGWLGNRLENYLKEDFNLTTTKRNSDTKNCIAVNFDEQTKTLEQLETFSFIVITIPFGKRNSLEELQQRFQNLSYFISDFKGQIILISSTGIYPNSEKIIHENSHKDSELNDPYIFIENLLKKDFSQLTILRLGGIMGDDRYLSKYLNLDRENLDEVVNHIYFVDIINVIKTCIKKSISNKTYNIVAPLHPTKREVLEYQINGKIIESETKKGKTISSDKLINELNYQFIHFNPIYFKD